MANEKFLAEWMPAPGLPNAFLFKKASYWKGQKGWWASRGDGSEMQGPFRGPRLAQAWAEEPYRAEWEAKVEKQRARKAEQEGKAKEKRESQARSTWGDLPPERRQLRKGQIWVRRGDSFAGQQIKIVEVRKETVMVRTRMDKTPWAKTAEDVRGIRDLMRLYRFLEEPRG